MKKLKNDKKTNHKSNGVEKMEQDAVTMRNDLNELHPRTRFSAFEVKFILYAIHVINKDDWNERTANGSKKPDFSYPYKNKNISIPAAEFSKIIGSDNGHTYKELNAICASLIEKSIIVKSPEITAYFTWFNSIHFNKETNIMDFIFSDHVISRITGLEGSYTKTMLETIMKLKTYYSIWIYQLVIQHKKFFKRKITINNLLTYLGISDRKTYEKYSQFKRGVIDPSIEDINENSDIKLDYEEILEGRKIMAIVFKIKNKTKKLEYLTPIDKYKENKKESLKKELPKEAEEFFKITKNKK